MKRPAMLYTEADREAMQQEMTQGQAVRTICNVVRYLSSLCHTPEQKYLCEEIMFMAKKMSRKLNFYKNNWDDGLCAPETDHVDAQQRLILG